LECTSVEDGIEAAIQKLSVLSCNFQVVMSLSTISLGLTLCTSRNGGTGGGTYRWVSEL